MLANECEYTDMTVSYGTDDMAFLVKYADFFKLNGEVVDTNYARYESDYVDGSVERKSDVIAFEFNGKSLVLNYNEGTREY